MIDLDPAEGTPEPQDERDEAKNAESGEPGAETLFKAMRGALRRTDRADLRGFGFFVVKPRKAAEEALSLLSAIFDRSSDAVIGITLDGKIAIWNRGAELMFGHSADDVTGSRVSILFSDEPLSRVMAALAQLHRGASSIQLEEPALTNDGRLITVQITVSAITSKRGKAIAASIVARDVTDRRLIERELRKSEDWFRALVEESTDLTLIVGPDGRITNLYPTSRPALGYEHNDLRGQALTELVYAQDLGAFDRFIADCSKSNASASARFRVRHADRSWRTLDATGRSLINDPRIAGVLVNVRDVTEQERITFLTSRAESESARMSALESFSALVSRDLDQALAPASEQTARLLAQLEPGSKPYQDVLLLRAAVASGQTVVERLKAIGQETPDKPKIVDLNKLITAMRASLNYVLGPEVELSTSLGEGLTQVAFDPAKLEGVILEIAAFARTAMRDRGGLTIAANNAIARERLVVDSREPIEECVVIDFVYSNAVIDTDTEPHIFEPFSTEPDVEWRAIDLAGPYAAIRRGGGRISVEPETSGFRILFPRANASQVSQLAAAELTRGVETVLLIERDDDARALAREILAAAGYAVLEARDPMIGRQLSEIHPAPIHLLIMDAEMSNPPSQKFEERLLAMRPEMKLLFTYADDAAAALIRLMPRQWPSLKKPFSPFALSERAREVIDEPGSMRARYARL